MNKALYITIVGRFLSLLSMEKYNKYKRLSLYKPKVFITEVNNESEQDYVLRHKNKAFSLIKSGQRLSVNKEMKLKHSDENSSLIWWQLEDVLVTKQENIYLFASLNFSVIVTEAGSFFTSSTYLNNYRDTGLLQILDNSIINNYKFNSNQEQYHVNIQLTLAGEGLQDSTIDVVHILQPKRYD